MSKNQHLSSLIKISLTANILLVTALPTIAYPVEINQVEAGRTISRYQELSNSPCYKNPDLPQCK